jgi:hypothetical protein
MATEYRLVIKGIKNNKEFVSHSPAASLKLAEDHRDELLKQTGLPAWQPNITSVEILSREVSDWERINYRLSVVGY